MSEKIFIYVDEFGTPALTQKESQNITTFLYIACAIKESEIENAIQSLNKINKEFFNNSRGKSKVLRRKQKKLIPVLKAIVSDINFIFYPFAVNKLHISRDDGGLRFKEVFYKFFTSFIANWTSQNFENFEIIFDSVISKEYGEELKEYLSNKFQNTLFENYKVSTVSDDHLLQLPDLIAGTIGILFNPDFSNGYENQILETLMPRSGGFNFYPNRDFEFYKKEENIKDVYDNKIFRLVREIAIGVKEESTNDLEKIVLKELEWYQNIFPTRYYSTEELVYVLRNSGLPNTSKEDLRRIIRDLRYKGVIIVTNAQYGGYKLAVNESEVQIMFDYFLKFITPMLKKIEIADDILKTKSVGNIQVLEDNSLLKEIILLIKSKQIGI